jgi:hypothetical protein
VQLRRREAAQHPLLHQRATFRRHSEAVLSAALVTELIVAALLVLAPRAGFVLATVLVVLYACELRRLPQDSSCNCFGGQQTTTAGDAVRRNAVLAGVALLGAVLETISPSAEINPISIGIALLLLSVPAARLALRGLTPAESTTPTWR